MTTTFRPPTWRLCNPHSIGPRVDHFHAYDEDDLMLCDPFLGLIRSIAEPDEGSLFCPECMEFARGRR